MLSVRAGGPMYGHVSALQLPVLTFEQKCTASISASGTADVATALECDSRQCEV